ncbi:sigma-70 family RNA polymerase sigma factor [Streptacidiphilus rugosus]|uniref:sigma-70 family RNA polymerase sigma factor n=1 Tax=Streptacidiphilus rugosus TaxID=405783 RepID=UPI00056C0094|nr:sigma-70 family RNA polymerase sigma factor [Streptacidiphilus rugosus]
MDEIDFLSLGFEEHRPHLRAVAYRMLGSLSEADDAVQDAWLRLDRASADPEGEPIENLGGWLTTVVARLCLNRLRSREHRAEDPLDARPVEPVVRREDGGDPEQEALLADAVGLAMLVVLDRLSPAERFAFVLHDMFAVPFEEISVMMERTPEATRQLASRARRRVKGATTAPAADLDRRRVVVDAYLTASRGGDFDALVALLDPDVVLRADPAVGPTPTPIRLSGAQVVAKAALASVDRARTTQAALVDGTVGLVMAPLGRLTVVLVFTVAADGAITEIEVIAEPERLRALEIAVL